jgi:hypothetical protein
VVHDFCGLLVLFSQADGNYLRMSKVARNHHEGSNGHRRGVCRHRHGNRHARLRAWCRRQCRNEVRAGDPQLVDLTIAVSLMNACNRLAIRFRNTPQAAIEAAA